MSFLDNATPESCTNICVGNDLNIPGNVNVAQLNVGNFEFGGDISGTINIRKEEKLETDDFTSKNITATESLTTTNLKAIGQLEYIFEPGDLISVIKKGTLNQAKINQIFTACQYLGRELDAFIPNANSLIDYYQVIYWGTDTRNNDVTRMSATLIVPRTIVDNTIVSFKKGTSTSLYQLNTTWNFLYAIENDIPFPYDKSKNIGPPNLTSVAIATKGYICITADNPGYGVSTGYYNLADPIGETLSQYECIVATTQIIKNNPSFFNTPTLKPFSAPYKVIQTGYAVGANTCVEIGQNILRKPTLFKLISIILGGLVNSSELVKKTLYINDGKDVNPNPISLFNIVLINNFSKTNLNVYPQLLHFKENIISDVFPLLDHAYLNTPKKIKNYFNDVLKYLKISSLKKNNDNKPFLEFGGKPAFIYPTSVLKDASGYSNVDCLFKNTVFFNNNTIDYTDLSKVPINVIYSLQDELTCVDDTPFPLGNPYVGTEATDRVIIPLEKFFNTSGDYGNFLNNPSSYSRTPTSVLNGDLSNLTTLINNNANILVDNEKNCKNTTLRWDTKARKKNPTDLLPQFTHVGFGVIWIDILLSYLTKRLQ